MIAIDPQNDRLGNNVTAEIRHNGPGTPKQIAAALDLEEGYTLRKLIGMERDGKLVVLRTNYGLYNVFGLADWWSDVQR